jgi:SAM-dependent methyltransferase
MKKKLDANLILDYLSEGEEYSDGEIEKLILKTFLSDGVKEKVSNILDNNPSWPLLYHLSPMRKNLLSWYDFKVDGSLLEVGSGCGALTGLFCSQLKNVTAIELTKRRAEITFNRNKNRNNLEVMAGNLNTIKLDKKFDYVTSIGVLEYAGKYTDSSNPFKDFILKLKSYLKKDGTLIIAIENKYGLKYWSGAREDHTARLFESLEGYPEQKDVNTFSKKEITSLLNSVGLNKVNFYYPMPDYKLPTEVFSDEYLPNINHNIKTDIFPLIDLSNPRTFLFNERLVCDGLVQEDIFDFFANSFLIFAREE